MPFAAGRYAPIRRLPVAAHTLVKTGAGRCVIPLGGMGICYIEREPMENKLRLSIGGMHCPACVRRVTNALSSLRDVRVDGVDIGSAQVTFDGAGVTPQEIAAAVNRIGFTAKVDGEPGAD